MSLKTLIPLLLLPCAMAFGQAPGEPAPAASPESARVVCVFDFVDLNASPDGRSSSFATLFSESIAGELYRAGYATVDETAMREAVSRRAAVGSALLDGELLMALALETGADVAIVGFYRVSGGGMVVGVRAYDLLGKRIAVGVALSGSSGIEVFETIDEIATAVGERVRQELKPLTEAELVVRREMVEFRTVVVEETVEAGTLADLTLLCDLEGAELFAGDRLLGTVEGGRVETSLKVGNAVTISVRAEGRYKAPHTLVVTEGAVEYRVPVPFRESAFELGPMTTTHFPAGAGSMLRWFPEPYADSAAPRRFVVDGWIGGSYLPKAWPSLDPADWDGGVWNIKWEAGCGWLFGDPGSARPLWGAFTGLQGEHFLAGSIGMSDIAPYLRLQAELPTEGGAAIAGFNIGFNGILSLYSDAIGMPFPVFLFAGYLWKL